MNRKLLLWVFAVIFLSGVSFILFTGNSDQGNQVAEKNNIVDKVNEPVVNNGEVIWYTDFEKAFICSQERNLPILILFTAPDSCVYCRKLEDEVLSQEEFKVWAKDNVILFVANFSDRENQDLLAQNYFLAEKFKVQDYPNTFIFFYSKKEEKLIDLYRISGYDANWLKFVEERIDKIKKGI